MTDRPPRPQPGGGDGVGLPARRPVVLPDPRLIRKARLVSIVVLALLNSPIVWFGLLVLSLTAAGVLYVLAGRPNATPPAPRPTPDFDSPAARRYHDSNQIGRN